MCPSGLCFRSVACRNMTTAVIRYLHFSRLSNVRVPLVNKSITHIFSGNHFNNINRPTSVGENELVNKIC